MKSTGASLSVKGLKKSWGPTEVLTGIDFDIEPGGFLTLLGPSGCGKSTALRLVSGLDEVSGGSILIDGKDVTKVPADQRNIGMVFQNYALFPHMTVAENLAFPLIVRKHKEDAIKKRVQEVLDVVALSAFGNCRTAQRSCCQHQLVDVAL